MSSRRSTAAIDSGSRAFALDPATQYAELRAKCPVSWQHSVRSWLVTRYDDVIAVLRNPKMPHAGILLPWYRLQEKHGWEFPRSVKVVAGMPFNYEGAAHAALRRSVARAIAPFADRHEHFRRQAARLLAHARRDGGLDFAEDFANLLLFENLCDFAEIAEADRAALRPMSHLSWAADPAISIPDRVHIERTLKGAFDLLHAEVPRQVAARPHSLLSGIYQALPADEPDKVSATMVSFCVMLIMGNDALGGCLSFGVRWLLDENRNKGESVPQARWGEISDDLLRQTAAVDFITRTAAEETTIGGVTLAAGEAIMLSPLSANHDSTKFGPRAHKISLDNNHGVGLAFGAGRHLCLGMHLSRNIAQTALSAVALMPSLRLEETERQGKGKVVRNLVSMPVFLT